jgi:hypothetical protein
MKTWYNQTAWLMISAGKQCRGKVAICGVIRPDLLQSQSNRQPPLTWQCLLTRFWMACTCLSGAPKPRSQLTSRGQSYVSLIELGYLNVTIELQVLVSEALGFELYIVLQVCRDGTVNQVQSE